MSNEKYVSSDGLLFLSQYIAGKLNEKVNFTEGKNLSANDFTNALKEKLLSIDLAKISAAYDARHEHENKAVLDTITQAAIESWSRAEANVISTIKVNGANTTVGVDKSVNIIIPTMISSFTNDAGFQTSDDVAAAIAEALEDAISNDFTDELREKLLAIDLTKISATYNAKHEHENKAILDEITQSVINTWNKAEANAIKSIKVNGTALSIAVDKSVNISVPKKMSDITNDSGFQTEDDVAEAIASAIDGVVSIKFELAETLPETGESGTIYLTANTDTADSDIYDEYVWLTNQFKKVGSTEIKLERYWNKNDLQVATDSEAATVFDSIF